MMGRMIGKEGIATLSLIKELAIKERKGLV